MAAETQAYCGLDEAAHEDYFMIFNTFAYYLLFLVPGALLFRVSPQQVKPWVLVTFGALFFIYFSYVYLGGMYAAACIVLFVWEATLQTTYRPGARICLVGILASLAILTAFKGDVCG